MAGRKVIVAAALFAAGIAPALAASLEGMLPRGRDVCYGGASEAFQRIRVTRPERLQSYDSARSRMVRIVVNFATPKGGRIEDTATCRERDGQIVCASTSCDGATFILRQEGSGFALWLESRPPMLWSCAEGAVRNVALSEAQRSVAMARSTGSCIAGQ